MIPRWNVHDTQIQLINILTSTKNIHVDKKKKHEQQKFTIQFINMHMFNIYIVNNARKKEILLL
jgi:hypothetical protein